MSARTRSAATVAATVCVMVAAAAVAVASVRHYHQNELGGSAPVSASAARHTVRASLPNTPGGFLGVYVGSSLTSYAPVDRFASAAGRQPDIVMYYGGWGEGFNTSFARAARSHGASLLVDLDPTHTSVASIADGGQDGYLESFAQSVRSYGHPVIISFGHEMNGNWYSWGWTHTSPKVWVRAWRHVVRVFRAVGADNVAWVWTVNAVTVGLGPISDWWPGAAYVTWTALDAYYYEQGSTFANVFGPTIAAIRKITNKPILIAETAIGQVAGQPAKIPGLFAGVHRQHLLGFIWFDQAQNGSLYHQDWRLEGHPAAVAAFRRSVMRYLKY
jgi:hypothetical protein